MEKKIIILCDLGVGGERGRVLDRKGIAGALSATEYKDAMKVIKLQIRERERVRCVPHKVLNDEDGLCRTLKSQYQKNSVANFVRGGTFGATGVIRKRKTDSDTRTCQAGNERQVPSR